MRCATLVASAQQGSAAGRRLLLLLLFLWPLALPCPWELRFDCVRMTRGTGVTAGSAVMDGPRLVMGAVAGASLHG